MLWLELRRGETASLGDYGSQFLVHDLLINEGLVAWSTTLTFLEIQPSPLGFDGPRARLLLSIDNARSHIVSKNWRNRVEACAVTSRRPAMLQQLAYGISLKPGARFTGPVTMRTRNSSSP